MAVRAKTAVKTKVKHSSKNQSSRGSGRAAGAVPKLLLTAEEAASALGISRGKLYPKLMRGDIFSVKDGGRRLVPVAALEAYIAALSAA